MGATIPTPPPGRCCRSFIRDLSTCPSLSRYPLPCSRSEGAQTYIPLYLPEFLGQDIDGFVISSGWWFASVVVSAAYVVVAVLTAAPSRIRWRRWRLMRKPSNKLRFDPVRLAIRPFARGGRHDDIIG